MGILESKDIKKLNLNSKILVFFFFQMGLFLPITTITGSQVIVALSSVVLVTILLVNNHFEISRTVIYFLLVSIVIFIVNLLFYEIGFSDLMTMYASFILKCLVAVVIGSFPINRLIIYDSMKKIAIINLILVSLVVLLRSHFDVSYMRFGYAMIPSSLVFLYGMIKEKNKLKWFLLLVVSLLLAVFYGSRGILIVFGMFFLLLIYNNRNFSIVIKLVYSTLIFSFIYIGFYTNFMLNILYFIYYEWGIKTYTISKLIMMIEQGIVASSSGRDLIYENLLSSFKENIFFGHGIASWKSNIALSDEYSYPHNFILQILIESGIIGIFLWIPIWYKSFKNYVYSWGNFSDEYYIILGLFISIAIGRLFVSSNLWERTEYWTTLVLLLRVKQSYPKKSAL